MHTPYTVTNLNVGSVDTDMGIGRAEWRRGEIRLQVQPSTEYVIPVIVPCYGCIHDVVVGLCLECNAERLLVCVFVGHLHGNTAAKTFLRCPEKQLHILQFMLEGVY